MVFDLLGVANFEYEPGESSRSYPDALAELKGLIATGNSKVSVVEVNGDRWGGKTMLLQDFSSAAAMAGWWVAAGSTTSVPPGVSFGVFIDALNELIGQHGADLSVALSPKHSRWLGDIFPALATTTPTARPDTPGEMYNTFHAIRQLITALCRSGDLLLQLDDMHWADEASVNLLAHLIRYPPAGRVVVVIAHRPRQSSDTLHSLMSATVANGIASRIVLAPLPDTDALALLPSDLSHPQCATLLHRAAGNPGLLKALGSLRFLAEESAGTPAQLPPDMLACCLRDFRAMSDSGWLVARSAAVLDEPFEPGMLAEVAQIGAAEVQAAIDELAGQDLVCADGSPSRLRFLNELLRMAAYQSAGLGWLPGAHSRAAAALAGRGQPTVQIAWHTEQVAVTGDRGSGQLLLDAAKSNIWNNPVQAASWVRTVEHLRLATPDGAPDRQLLLGKALALAGRLAEAHEVLVKVTAAGPEGCPGWAEAMRWQAWVSSLAGRPDEASGDLAAVMRAVPPDRMDPLARARLARLILTLEADAPAAEDDDIVLCQQQARCGGLPAGYLAAVLAAAACRNCGPGDRRHAAAAAAVFDNASDDELAEHLDGLYWLVRAERALGKDDAAAQHCERGLHLAEQRRQGSMVPRFAALLGTLQLYRGDRAGAMRHAACARTAAAGTGSAHLLAAAAQLEASIRRMLPACPTQYAEPGWAAPQCGEPAGADGPAGQDRHRDAPSRLDSLSRRELEIAFLVSSGRTNQQIARILGLSHKTVETYLARTFKKLVVSCRAEVAAIVGRSEP
jgi:DNA-binding CsgD family transcriptional regulator